MSGGALPMKVTRRYHRTTPVHELREFRTPADQLFVVYHMGIPAVDAASWRVTVGGLVERPLELTLADLDALPKVEVRAFHECAGSPLHPTVAVRRVGSVTWRGVQLKRLLAEAGVRPEAGFVWSRGADYGMYAPTNSYNDCYLKDLPLEKALADEVLLATELNGAPLSEEHGAPVRLVVPGYYGTNSVKWLNALRVERMRAGGLFTTRLYNDRSVEHGVETISPVWAVAPHSVIVAPAAGRLLPLAPLRISGWAWGATPIERVDVSTDGGVSWAAAGLDEREQHCWQGFAFDWTPVAPGDYVLASRATDAAGRMQPLHPARNDIFRIKVHVDA